MQRFEKGAQGMGFYGNPDVLRTLKQQSKQASPDVNLVVVMPGGGQKGVFLAGAADAIHRAGLTKGISLIVANSSGAAVGSRLIDGNESALDIFHHQNPKRGLIEPFRFNPYFKIDTLIKMFKNEYPLDIEAFKNNPTRLLVSAYNVTRKREELIDAGSLDNPDSIIFASMLFPGVTGLPHKTIRVNSNKYADGWLENPFLIDSALEQKPTHILFISPNPVNYRCFEPKGLSKLTGSLEQNGSLPHIWHSLASYPERFNSGARRLQSLATGQLEIEGVEIAIIAPTENMNTFLMSERELWKRQLNSREFVSGLLFAA